MGRDLKERVQQRRADVATRGEEKPKTLAEQIEAKAAIFQQALPDGAEARHLIRDAMSLVRQTPQLAKCDANTVLGGLMTFAQLGLRPGVLGHGWLVPFKKRTKVDGKWVDVWEAQVIIGYKGYAELIYRTGAAMTMVSRTVHENDRFTLAYGVDDRLEHEPATDGPRGEVTGYYTVIKFKGGGYVFWYMSRAECEEWRDKYAMARKGIFENGRRVGEEIVGPWRDNFDAMALKTTFLRAQNLAPKATQLARAVAVDGAVRRDTDPDPDSMLFADYPSVIDGSFVADDYEDEQQPEDAPAEQPAPLPDPETQTEEWHAAKHPRLGQLAGEIQTADVDEWCELCRTEDKGEQS